MERPTITWDAVQWIHFSSIDEMRASWLEGKYGFHELDLADCLAGKAQQPKREVYDDHNFLILHFPQIVQSARYGARVQIMQLNVFVSKEYLITITYRPIDIVDDYFDLLTDDQKLQKEILGQGTGYLLHELIDRMTDQSIRVVESLGRKIDAIDRDLFLLRRKSIQDISLTRRNLIISTTTIKPMVKLFAALEATSVPYLNNELNEYWSNIKDEHLRMSELLADDAELLSGLTEAFDVLLTHGTNQIIKVLTIFSVLLLPMTLLTGLYGMNVALPFEQDWWTFGLIIAIMLFVSVAMVAFFRYKRWI